MTRLLAGALVCASAWASTAAVRVDDAATRVVLRNGKSTVLLAVENGSGRAVAAR
jgi:hypothetical protein